MMNYKMLAVMALVGLSISLSLIISPKVTHADTTSSGNPINIQQAISSLTDINLKGILEYLYDQIVSIKTTLNPIPGEITTLTNNLNITNSNVTSLQTTQSSQSAQINSLESQVSSNSADISSLKTSKTILDYKQYQSTDIFTTTSETDTATPALITLNCPVACELSVNYWADNRTDTLPTVGESQGYQIIYVDGVRSNNYSSAIFSIIGDPLMVSMGGLFSVGAGTHTVQIYAWQHYGTLDIREKVLTGIAFGQ